MRTRTVMPVQAVLAIALAGCVESPTAFEPETAAAFAQSVQQGSGTTIITGLTAIPDKFPGKNVFLDLTITGDYTGFITGSFTEDAVIVVHPNGKTTFRGTRYFTGTIGGRAGSCEIEIVGTGDAVDPLQIRGQFVVRRGTGGLEGVHGQGTFQVTSAPPLTDAYIGKFHFHP